jgi:hypothetical protein
MKKYSIHILLIIFGTLIFSISCQKDEYDLGEIVAPSNVSLSYEIVGADAENPNGDGSGFVNFTATATNAITYNFDFGDGSDIVTSASGKVTKRFSITGTNTYNVTVNAIGTGGITSSKADQVEVLSTFEDADALQFLTGGSSKTWYWAYDQPGHVGLGPATENGENNEITYDAWWSIGPNDEEKSCMYVSQMVFTQTESGGLTFEQISGPAFIPGAYAGVIGVTGDVCHGEDVVPNIYGVKNVSFAPSSSEASVLGEYRGTTMNFSDGGFMCWWVGKSEYDIIEVTDNILKVRIQQDDEFAWYHTFTSVQPE